MDSFVQLLERGVAIIAPLQALVAGTCLLMGLVFVARSIVGMASAHELRSIGGAASGSYTGPLVLFFVGSLLISLSTVIGAFLMSFFLQSESVSAEQVFTYAPEITKPLSAEMSQRAVIALVRFAQFIGLLGFVRGLFLLGRTGNGGQIGDTGRGIVHLVAGTLAINIVVVLQMLENLLVK